MSFPLSNWVNFWVVVTVQGITLLVMMALKKPGMVKALTVLPLALLAGLVIGVAFDLLIGKSHGIFFYEIPLTLPFVTVNGIFSYGIAVLTSTMVPISLPLIGAQSLRRGLVVFAISIATILTCFARAENNLIMAIGIGATVVTLGETFLVLRGRAGPILQLVFKQPDNFFRLWLLSALIGATYEVANYYFPVWRWNIFGEQSEFLSWVTVIFFGYFVLFHALIVLPAVLTKRR